MLPIFIFAFRHCFHFTSRRRLPLMLLFFDAAAMPFRHAISMPARALLQLLSRYAFILAFFSCRMS